MGTELLPQSIRDNYEVHEWRHACAILKRDFRLEWDDIIEVLGSFRLKRSDIAVAGGNKSLVAGNLDKAFVARGNLRTLAPGRRQVNVVVSQKREHSRKPDELYDIIERCSPGPYLELFARQVRPGWAAWGDEATSYDDSHVSPVYSGRQRRHRADGSMGTVLATTAELFPRNGIAE